MIICGYYLTRRSDRPAWLPPNLAPERMLSACACIADFAPREWAIEWCDTKPEKRLKEAQALGIREDMLPEVIRWSTTAINDGRLGWPGIYKSLDAAREFKEAFLHDHPEYFVLGVALPEEEIADFLVATHNPSDSPTGQQAMAELGRPPAPGGVILGFEVLGHEVTGAFHSSVCTYQFHDQLVRKHGFHTNEEGFFSHHSEAKRMAAICDDEKSPTERIPWRAFEILAWNIDQ